MKTNAIDQNAFICIYPCLRCDPWLILLSSLCLCGSIPSLLVPVPLVRGAFLGLPELAEEVVALLLDRLRGGRRGRRLRREHRRARRLALVRAGRRGRRRRAR